MRIYPIYSSFYTISKQFSMIIEKKLWISVCRGCVLHVNHMLIIIQRDSCPQKKGGFGKLCYSHPGSMEFIWA